MRVLTALADARLGLLVALLLGVVLVGRRSRAAAGAPPRVGRLATAVALLVMLLTVWVWGGIRAPAVVDDEAAYLLQAELFAAGHWRVPSPEPPAAFTQPAVLVTPVMAPKMAPGHALVLAPGALLGLPGLVPVVMSGLISALIIVLVGERRSPGVALLTVALWLTAAGQWRWRASYFSENTTGMLWLAGWLALLRWRETGRQGWLLALAAMTGWIAITRPLTAVAFALPVAIMVLRDVVRRRRWRQLAAAAGLGTVVLMLLPLQNRQVLGDWRASPLALYTRQYMPFDKVGFGLDSTPPTLGLPAAMQGAQEPFMARHREHRPAALPAVLATRLRVLSQSLFGGWRIAWIPAAMIGLAVVGASGWFALVGGLLLYVAYLLYAHEAHWSVYYYEASPIFAFVIASGLGWLLVRATGRERLGTGLAAGAAAAILVVAIPDLRAARGFRDAAQRPYRALADATAGQGRLLVFVRYTPTHDPNVNLVRNVVDARTARVVTALERGPEADAEVIRAHPGREVRHWDGDANQFVEPAVIGPAIP